MRIRPRALALVFAACSGTTPASSTTSTPPATLVAVPLTASTAQIAMAQTTRAELVPPWSLTASDGSGLALVRVDAKAVFEGPLAFTELHLYFHNAENRRREGTFQITLPAHAAVSRFAMENEGQWMEAEIVEKQLARRAYDDFLHRRQDPALLEKAPGNQFTAKVFPIAPNADKHIVISYSQELPGAQYVLPLRGLPKIGKVDVQLAISGADGKHAMQALNERDWQPDRDFVSNVTGVAAAVEAGPLVAAQVSIAGLAPDSEPPAAMTILVDTSASRGLGYAAYVHSVRELVGKLAARYHDLPIDVIAFDQDHEAIFSGKAGEFGDAQEKQLMERGAAGASDLGQALAAVKAAHQRVLVITDGVVTAGAERAALTEQIKKLAIDRLDVALAGGIRDDELASALVHTGLPHAGAVLDLGDGAEPVAIALGQPVMVDVPVDIAGATWVYPHVIATARPGTSQMVYARLAKPSRTLDLSIGGKRASVSLLAGTAPLVERAVASAEIDELEGKLATAAAADAPALRAEIAKRSIASRVVSSQTSLLVLETDADYARYGIDRKSLADILAIHDGTLERLHRQAPAQIAQPEPVITAHTTTTKAPEKADQKQAFAGTAKTEEKRDPDKLGFDEAKPEPADAPPPSRLEAQEMPDPNAADETGKAGDVVNGAPLSAHGGGAAAGSGSAADSRPEQVARPTVALAPPPPPPAPRPTPAHRAMRPPRADMDNPLGGEGDADGIADSGDNDNREPWPPRGAPPALTGELAEIESALAAHHVDAALAKARDWHAKEPGDVLALIGLGDALEAKGSAVTAARIYGSIIDLFPGRADLRRFAAERLARVTGKLPAAQALIVDDLQRAVDDRPDHLTGHRLLAYALVRAGKPGEAFTQILAAIDHPYRTDSYAGAQRVLAEDAGMIGAAYLAASPDKRKEITSELAKRHLALATKPSTRFILYWETDGNDVDFHIQDARGNHAWYAHKQLASGGELYADITTGYGPECFAIPGTPNAGPYRLSINYYSQGPMGYGMGLLEVQRFDGRKLAFEDRPYVIMSNQAYVDLGSYR